MRQFLKFFKLLYNKMRQFLKFFKRLYYKMRQFLKFFKLLYNKMRQFYYNMWQFLQNAMVLSQNATVITKWLVQTIARKKHQSFLSIKNNIPHETTWDEVDTSCSKTGVYEILCNTQQVMNTTKLRTSQSKLEAS